MSPILIGLVLVGVLMLLLALFAGRGAGETRAARAKPALDLTLPELTRALRDAFAARGFTVLSEADEPGRADLLLKDASPLTGQTIYLRCLAPADGAVDSVEVQAALDRIRGDQLEKAVVATPGEFTQEARALARGTNVELLDGAALEVLLGQGGRRAPALGPPVRTS
ncbi:MAG TPA: restriction endonuclease [Myxococcaceae bacterium]|nr:restriction endonuclease [Myxococcaceae bacterium]